ncbi:uncharacterized protein TNCT_618211 [Trichonephila clavata]|uniref:Uncharacterized protein n=1 Tax=Trichonephila clavata TaxID=2740835 RepID=A0A8X6JMA5_TRICU|nr:uncharacterized protein TNCT_618211 [Trichonephila clavata]
MQRRSESHNVADSLLLELFLQQLPPNVQSILASIQPLTAQKASEVADRILEVTPAQVSAASKYSSANSDNCSEWELLKELKFLRQEVKELRRSRSFSRNHFNSPNRGKSSKPTASNLCCPNFNESGDVVFFKFGLSCGHLLVILSSCSEDVGDRFHQFRTFWCFTCLGSVEG